MTIFSPPPAPTSIGEAGISRRMVLDLILKLMHMQGLETISELAGSIRLPGGLIGEMLDEARELAVVQTLGGRGSGVAAELRFDLTEKGHGWAADALARSSYIGPAPVSLADFHRQVEEQRLAKETVHGDELARCFAHLVLPEELLRRLGPAINSGKSILLYGRSGNGKTAIAEALRDALDDRIAVPFAIVVDGQIIAFYDVHVHGPLAEADDDSIWLRSGGCADRRWH